MSGIGDSSALKGKRFFPFVAPPNGGKGTQTAALLKRYPNQLSKVDMGAMLRAAAADPSYPNAKLIKEAQDAGRLVELPIVMDVLEWGLTKAATENKGVTGFILDGFPRNVQQLDKLVELCNKVGADLAKAFYLNVPDQVSVDRAAGRVFKKGTDEVFNLRIAGMYPPGYQPGQPFDLEANGYYQRKDDEEATVRKRLEGFKAETQPMIDKFRTMGRLVEVNGDRKPDEITQDILAQMETGLKEPLPTLSMKVLVGLGLVAVGLLALLVGSARG